MVWSSRVLFPVRLFLFFCFYSLIFDSLNWFYKRHSHLKICRCGFFCLLKSKIVIPLHFIILQLKIFVYRNYKKWRFRRSDLIKTIFVFEYIRQIYNENESCDFLNDGKVAILWLWVVMAQIKIDKKVSKRRHRFKYFLISHTYFQNRYVYILLP